MARDWAVHDGDDQLHIFLLAADLNRKIAAISRQRVGISEGIQKNTNLLSTHLN